MMFSEDYVQSMVTARDAAALTRDVELIRVVHERFAEVPARRWWRRLGDVLAVRGTRRGRRGVEQDAAQPTASAAGARAGVSEPAGAAGEQGLPAGAASGRELAGTRR